MRPKAEVVQFHDILSQELVRYLLNDTNKLQPFVMSMMAFELSPFDRLGGTLWIETNSSRESLRITNIVEKATGLRVTEKDALSYLQIGTYAPGSHYKPHSDTVSKAA